MEKIYKQEANNIDNSAVLIEVLYDYLKHWKWFIVSIILALSIAVGVVIVSSKQYRPTLSVLLNEEKGSKGASSELMDIESLGLLSTTSNIENEIIVLGSPDLMEQVVKALDANISYSHKRFFRETEIYKESPFIVEITSGLDAYSGRTEIEIQKLGEIYKIAGVYYLEKSKSEFELSETKLPATISINDNITLSIKLSDRVLEENEIYYIVIDNLAATTSDLTSKLAVTNSGQKSSVINLALNVNNTQKGIDILNELVRQYNDLNLRLYNEIAYNTSIFINERLKEISVELSDAEEDVVEYKQQHKIADLSTEAQLFVSQTGENEAKLLEIETQLNVLSLVQDFIKNPSNNTNIIPNMGISDVGLSEIISEFNNKLLASNQLIKGTGERNPARVRVLEELDNMRDGIASSLVNVRKTYQVSRSELRKKDHATTSRIRSVPKQEKGLIEKVREQKIKENLFLFLMQKREETNLSMAATADKARIVISARGDILPVAPKSKVILLAFIILGLLVPIIIIYIINLFKTKISNRDELERMSNVSIIGEVGVNKTSDFLVVSDQHTAISEMFRSLRNNIKFASNKEKGLAIMMTSTIASEGKSFISVNLALSFAYTGKKVLLIGGDIRNPKLHDYLDSPFLKGRKGLSDFLVSNDSNKSNYIFTPYTEITNFDVLISGTIPPNPNELLMSPKLKELIEETQKEYDYIIIDSAPVGLVSDSYLIGEHVDLSLYVVRENKTPKAAINFINMQLAENKLKNMYVVLNDTALRNSYKYGYGKGYGYGKQ